jgi:hypothetical protein
MGDFLNQPELIGEEDERVVGPRDSPQPARAWLSAALLSLSIHGDQVEGWQ